ncbi:MAG: helix-turn-helix domain-containing protein [Melioribacteraceae bacterium]
MKLTYLFLAMFLSGNLFSQTIWIKDVNNKLVSKASVSVQVTYKSTQFLLEGSLEKLFTAVTDTLGKMKISGEYSKEEFSVESVSIKVQHKDFEPFEVITKEYSNSPSFNYIVYLVPKNSKVNLSGKIIANRQEVNELDIYSSSEIADKLQIKEDDILNLIKKKKIKGKKIGDKYFVSGDELRKYLDE